MIFFTTASNVKFFFVLLCLTVAMAMFGLFFMEGKAQDLILKKDDEYNNFLVAAKDKNVALIGTSHSAVSLSYFSNREEVLDLSGAYTIPTVMYFKLKRTLEKAPHLKILYLEADYHLFYEGPIYTSDRSDGVRRWSAFFEPFAEKELGELYAAPTTFVSFDPDTAPILIKRIIEDYVRPFIPSQNHSQDQSLKKFYSMCDDDSWSSFINKAKKNIVVDHKYWHDLTENDKYKSAKGRQTEGFGMIDNSKPSSLMLDYYQKAIKLAKDNDISVVLIRNPLPKEYLESIPENIINDTDRYLQKLETKYGLDILDYRYFINKSEMFYNADHLNQYGAVDVSQRLRNYHCNA